MSNQTAIAQPAPQAMTPFRQMTESLRNQDRIANMERVLPAFVKGQAERFMQRALFYWARSEDVQQCTPESFVRCVLEAAELGFCIDGKLCHAVKFNTKISKRGEPDRYANVCTLIVDYKGLLAVAKRNNVVADAWAKIVLPSDVFSFREMDGKQQYEYQADLRVSRDHPENPIGVLAVARHKDGWFRAEFMPIVDVMAIRDQSKGYDPKWKNCPWVKHEGQMIVKTGIKRLLKTFTDDPGLLRAMEIDDASETIDITGEDSQTAQLPSRASMVIQHIPPATEEQPQTLPDAPESTIMEEDESAVPKSWTNDEPLPGEVEGPAPWDAMPDPVEEEDETAVLTQPTAPEMSTATPTSDRIQRYRDEKDRVSAENSKSTSSSTATPPAAKAPTTIVEDWKYRISQAKTNKDLNVLIKAATESAEVAGLPDKGKYIGELLSGRQTVLKQQKTKST